MRVNNTMVFVIQYLKITSNICKKQIFSIKWGSLLPFRSCAGRKLSKWVDIFFNQKLLNSAGCTRQSDKADRPRFPKIL